MSEQVENKEDNDQLNNLQSDEDKAESNQHQDDVCETVCETCVDAPVESGANEEQQPNELGKSPDENEGKDDICETVCVPCVEATVVTNPEEQNPSEVFVDAVTNLEEPKPDEPKDKNCFDTCATCVSPSVTQSEEEPENDICTNICEQCVNSETQKEPEHIPPPDEGGEQKEPKEDKEHICEHICLPCAEETNSSTVEDEKSSVPQTEADVTNEEHAISVNAETNSEPTKPVEDKDENCIDVCASCASQSIIQGDVEPEHIQPPDEGCKDDSDMKESEEVICRNSCAPCVEASAHSKTNTEEIKPSETKDENCMEICEGCTSPSIQQNKEDTNSNELEGENCKNICDSCVRQNILQCEALGKNKLEDVGCTYTCEPCTDESLHLVTHNEEPKSSEPKTAKCVEFCDICPTQNVEQDKEACSNICAPCSDTSIHPLTNTEEQTPIEAEKYCRDVCNMCVTADILENEVPEKHSKEIEEGASDESCRVICAPCAEASLKEMENMEEQKPTELEEDECIHVCEVCVSQNLLPKEVAETSSKEQQVVSCRKICEPCMVLDAGCKNSWKECLNSEQQTLENDTETKEADGANCKDTCEGCIEVNITSEKDDICEEKCSKPEDSKDGDCGDICKPCIESHQTEPQTEAADSESRRNEEEMCKNVCAGCVDKTPSAAVSPKDEPDSESKKEDDEACKNVCAGCVDENAKPVADNDVERLNQSSDNVPESSKDTEEDTN